MQTPSLQVDAENSATRFAPRPPRWLLCLVLVAGLGVAGFNVWLCHDQDVVVGLSDVDELFFMRKGECTYWLDKGYHFERSFLKEAPYPVFIAISYRLGLPLRLSHEMFFLAAAAALSACLVYRQTNPVVGLMVFTVVSLIPARFFVFRQPLHDAIYTSALLFTVAALIWQLKRQNEPGRWRRQIMTGLAVGLLWNVRQERQLVLVLLAVFAVSAWPLLTRKETWPKTIGAWLREWTPGFALAAAMTFGLMAANYARWGLFVTSEFAAPQLDKAYRELLTIKPETPILYAPITKEMRRRAQAVSPTFQTVEVVLENQAFLQDHAPRWLQYQNVPYGEFSGGWFVLALRDAVVRSRGCKSAAEMEEVFGTIAAELQQAKSERRLESRWLMPGLGWAVNPDIQLYTHMLPASWRSMWYNCWSFRIDLYPQFDPPETPPEIRALFDRVGRRGPVAADSPPSTQSKVREWLSIQFTRYSQLFLAAGCLVGGTTLFFVRGRFDWRAYLLPAWVFGVYGFARLAVFTLFDAGAFPGADTRYLFPAPVALLVAATWLLGAGVSALLFSRRWGDRKLENHTLARPAYNLARKTAVAGLLIGGLLLIVQWRLEKIYQPDVIAQAGSMEGIDDGAFWGFARLRERPGEIVDVGFYEDGKLVAHARADDTIVEVTSNFPYLAGHCFRCPIPASLRDGKEHRLIAKIIGTECHLANTPTTFRE